MPESVNDLYPVIKERWSGPNITAVTNEIEASYTAGFDVKFPTKMPSSDYKLQLGIVDRETGEDNKYVFLYYSDKPITNDMRLNQFWEQGGVWVIYHKNIVNPIVFNKDGSISTSYHDMTEFLKAAKAFGQDAYSGNINGHPMVAIRDLHREFSRFAIHDPTQIDFIAGNTYVTLQGYRDTDELIEIAKSMLFDAANDHHRG